MKQLIRLLFASLKVDMLARFFVVGNMAVSFIDCAYNFYKLYAWSFHLGSLCFFILGYFFILYLKKIKRITFDKKCQLQFLFLRAMILAMLFLPIGIDNNWHLVSIRDISGQHGYRIFIEVLQIFGIEVALEILYKIDETVKQGRHDDF